MTIILPENYHAQQALEENRVACIRRDRAEKQDIRPLRIGILNIMPNLQDYEFNLLNPLGRSIIQIEPVWIRLESHGYSSSDPKHLEELYITYAEANKKKTLDGLIITGAPVGKIPFEQIRYWDEITQIFDHARANIVNTLGICWGGVAMSHYLGFERTFNSPKLFGVFPSRNLKKNHPITGLMDEVFDCPQSRYSKLDDEILEAAAARGEINLLAYEKKSGYFIFETADQRFLINLGHPEYNSGRILDEARRDALNKTPDCNPPENFDLENPINTWRANRNEFFRAWIKYLYLENEY